MQYRRKVIILSGLLGLLTATAVLGWLFGTQAVTERQAQQPLIAGYAAAEVSGLELKNGVVLKKAGSWTMTYKGRSFPVSQDRVETYLKTLASLQRERLVTREGDGSALGLAQGFQTLRVIGKDGKVLADLEVGGTNDLGNKVFVRLSGGKEIWQTDRGFARTLEIDFNTWTDLSLFPGRKAADLTRISFDSRIETADKVVYTPFDLVKTSKDGKSVWENRLSGTSSEAMGAWADLVVSFRASAFVDPEEPATVGTSLGTLTLSWADSTTSILSIGPPDAQNRYRVRVGDREVWVSDWSFGQLLYH